MLQVEHIKIAKHLQILNLPNIKPLQMYRLELDNSLNPTPYNITTATFLPS